MYALLRSLLFRLPPETAHRLTVAGLEGLLAVPGATALLRRWLRAEAPVSLMGMRFANPVGLAAGFDKNALHVHALAALGFGFIEIGSVTALPAPGNAQPRLFRLPADRAIINRMGLNNLGAEITAQRLAALRAEGLPVPLFVNVAKSHDPTVMGDAAVADYVTSVRLVQAHADAMVINISCPNSGDGRTFEDPEVLGPLLEAIRPAVDAHRPLLVKLGPDLPDAQLEAVVRLSLDCGVTGFTATNTTVNRSNLSTAGEQLEAIGRGGLSGAPLRDRARAVVAKVRAYAGPAVPIVGVGGISDGADAQAMLDAGADLVQLYTGFIYGGPTTVRRIVQRIRPAG
jgi:dihydroorotate dehydrogenase